jgi:3-keto-5-aminohexanoate cleavage enzyme
MAFTDKVIVTVAPTGAHKGKEANPALPCSSEEIVNAVYECWNEGASLAHIHARDRLGMPTNDPSFFEEIDRLIRDKKCDIIIEHSMGPAFHGQDTINIDDGVKSSRTDPPPEMVSLPIAPTNEIGMGKAILLPWGRLWAENVAKELLEKGIKADPEIWNDGQIDTLLYLIDNGLLRKPYFVNIVTNFTAVDTNGRYNPKRLMLYVDLLPADCMFSMLAMGLEEFQATTLSLLLGGHVRLGFEDNIYIQKDKLAKNNAESIQKIVQIARALGREIATPQEARQMLGLRSLK